MTAFVPPIVLALAKQPLVDQFDLSSLRFMLSGAAPLSAELEVACGNRLGCRMEQGYGLTETSPTTHSVPDDLAGQMPGSIGPAVPNTECRIVDVLTGEDAPAGEPGELCIRGPQVMKGYLNNSEATAATIDPDGWLHTGDVARVDEHGSVRIVDRLKELIKYKGCQVAPAELEGLLLTHPRDRRCGGDRTPRRGGRRGPEGVRRGERAAHAGGGERLRRGAGVALQEGSRRRARPRDPEDPVREGPAPRADRAGAGGGTYLGGRRLRPSGGSRPAGGLQVDPWHRHVTTCMLARTLLAATRGIDHVLGWSLFRRLHQTRVLISHYCRRGDPLPAELRM
jgi:hypothetical protein